MLVVGFTRLCSVLFLLLYLNLAQRPRTPSHHHHKKAKFSLLPITGMRVEATYPIKKKWRPRTPSRVRLVLRRQICWALPLPLKLIPFYPLLSLSSFLFHRLILSPPFSCSICCSRAQPPSPRAPSSADDRSHRAGPRRPPAFFSPPSPSSLLLFSPFTLISLYLSCSLLQGGRHGSPRSSAPTHAPAALPMSSPR